MIGRRKLPQQPAICFVHLGSYPVPWLYHNLRGLARFEGLRPVVISDQRRLLIRARKLGAETFEVAGEWGASVGDESQNTLDDRFRQGFWQKTWWRFRALLEYQRATEEPVVHVESDVALLETSFLRTLDLQPRPLAFSLLSQGSASGALLYSRSSEPLARLVSHLDEHIKSTAYGTDMSGLYSFWRSEPSSVCLLPLAEDARSQLLGAHLSLEVRQQLTSEYGRFQCTFDPAPVGQYLLGTDPRNLRGVIRLGYQSEEHFQVPSAVNFLWHDGNLTYAVSEGRSPRIATLHVHSKDARAFYLQGLAELLNDRARRRWNGRASIRSWPGTLRAARDALVYRVRI